MKPRISIFGSAHRPQNWMDLYKSIGENKVDFEIVFVGPNEPRFELPSNFKFIKSLTKPTQCLEIASRHVSADLIMNIADDMEFKTNRPLDLLYNTYKAMNDDKVLLSCRFMRNGKDMSDTDQRFYPADKSSPIMPMSGLMSKKLYRELGGIDKNFIAVMWDLDVAMRAFALGGKVLLSDVFVEEFKVKSSGSNLCSDYWRHDRGLLESLWTSGGKTHFNRSRPVEPFSDSKIIDQSQGPRGMWRGSAPIIVEMLVDGLNRIKRFKIRSYIMKAYVAISNPGKAVRFADGYFFGYLF